MEKVDNAVVREVDRVHAVVAPCLHHSPPLSQKDAVVKEVAVAVDRLVVPRHDHHHVEEEAAAEEEGDRDQGVDREVVDEGAVTTTALRLNQHQRVGEEENVNDWNVKRNVKDDAKDCLRFVKNLSVVNQQLSL